jgi:hypothetical protein
MLCESAVVLYGCSVAQGGGGLPRVWSLATQLSQRINRPVIDLAVAGGSNCLIEWQQRELHTTLVQPWLEIVIWTEPVRFTDFATFQGYGTWNRHRWPSDQQPFTDLDYWRDRSRELRQRFLERSPRTIELTWNSLMREIAPEIRFWPRSTWQDHSADRHPGPQTVAALADQLAHEIYSI